jgi:DNA-binding transcriptional ArsR family regulator
MGKTSLLTMSSPPIDTLPDEQLEKIAFLAKSLSDVNRLRILLALEKKGKSVSVLVEGLGLSQPLVSHHLRELRRTLLVTVKRKGPFVYYSLADSSVVDKMNDLLKLAERLLAQKNGFG